MVGYKGADVLVIDPDAGLCLAQPLCSADIGVGRHQLHTPSAWAAAVAHTVGVPATYLRSELDADGVPLRVECAVPGGSKMPNARLRWADWVPQPPLHERISWERPCWMASATAYIDREIGQIGGRRTAPLIQVRHNAMVALIKAETTRGPVWLKTLGEPFSREARAMKALSALCPTALPTIMADEADWFILDSFAVQGDGRPTDPYAVLADLQIASARAPDRFGDWPRRDVAALAEGCRNVIEMHPLIDAAIAQRLEASLPDLAAFAARAAGCGLPDTVVHGDFHADNRYWTGRRWIFYDWSDSVVGHPLLDFGLAYHLEPPDRLRAGLLAYADRWKRAFPATDMATALATAPVLSCAHQLICYAAIARSIPSLHAWSQRQMSLWAGRVADAVERAGPGFT